MKARVVVCGPVGAGKQPQAVPGGRFGIDVIAMGAGLGIAIFGATTGGAGVAGSGALIFALGLAWYLIKRSAIQR